MTTEKLKDIKGHSVNTGLVEILEFLLEEAKIGSLQSGSMAVVWDSGTSDFYYQKSATTRMDTLIGCMHTNTVKMSLDKVDMDNKGEY